MFKVKFPTGAGWLKGLTVFFRTECPAIPLLRVLIAFERGERPSLTERTAASR
jgi:hypothetical protein